LVGGAYPVEEGVLVDRGLEGNGLTLEQGLVFNTADKSLDFDGSTYAAATAVSAASQVGPFTVVTAVRPANNATQSTVWEFGTASTETLSLQVDGARFALRYGASQATLYLAPMPWLATHNVVVRCSRGRTLCTLTSY
jgi:hypothetical protein